MASKVLRRVLVGSIGVDSGQVIICDPCYLINKMDEKLYDKIFDVKMKDRISGTTVENQAAEVPEISAVTSFTGLGDGGYEVYATITNEGGPWGERVSKLEIIFIPDEDDSED
jgi:hypothetical protein